MQTKHLKRSVLVASALASFLVPYTTSSITVALPSIGDQFGLDPVTLGWITTAYIFTTAILILPFGRLADLYGRKRFFIAGTFIFVLGSAFCAFSPSAGWLIAARVFQGIGGAFLFATSIAIVTQVFPEGERGRAIGLITATIYAGLSIGPFLGGILTYAFGWQSIFLFIVPPGVVAVALIAGRMPVKEAKGEGSFDLPGAVFYASMVFCLLYGLTLLPSPPGYCLLAGGLVLTVVFLGFERRARDPMLAPGFFRSNMTFSLSNIAAMINYGATFAVGFLLSLYFQQVRGFDPQLTGLILVSQPIVQTLVSPVAGRLSDTVEPRLLASAGMAITAAGIAPFAFLTDTTPVSWILGSLVVLGLGYGFFSSPNTNAIMSSVRPVHLGIASGMVSTMRTVGMVASVAVAMICFSLFPGAGTVTPEVHSAFMVSIRAAFTVFFVLCVIGVATSYARGSLRNPAPGGR